MNQAPVAAVGLQFMGSGASSSEVASSLERSLGGDSLLQRAIATTSTNASAALGRVDHTAPDLKALLGMVGDGLQNGFYAAEMRHAAALMSARSEPGSLVKDGDVVMAAMNVHHKIEFAKITGQLATKFSDALDRTIVRNG